MVGVADYVIKNTNSCLAVYYMLLINIIKHIYDEFNHYSTVYTTKMQVVFSI